MLTVAVYGLACRTSLLYHAVTSSLTLVHAASAGLDIFPDIFGAAGGDVHVSPH